MTLFFLPGFLGKYKGSEAVTPPQTLQAQSLEEYGVLFNRFAESFPAPRILTGYSMGGRQALHALASQSTLYEKVILVSTHPGLQNEQERSLRLKQDALWAKRFLTESWDTLLADWNAQPVFNGSEVWQRDEKDFQRKTLAHELLSYSLGRQKDLRPEINKRADQILMVTGELDHKFTKLTEELASSVKKIILSKSGHRINFPLILDEVIAKIPPRFNHGKMDHN